MSFLKKIFDDESVIVGLCSFKSIKPKYNECLVEQDVFFNPFEKEINSVLNYQTNFAKNVLLL